MRFILTFASSAIHTSNTYKSILSGEYTINSGINNIRNHYMMLYVAERSYHRENIFQQTFFKPASTAGDLPTQIIPVNMDPYFLKTF